MVTTIEEAAALRKQAIESLGWFALHVRRHTWRCVCPLCGNYDLYLTNDAINPATMECRACGTTDAAKVQVAQEKIITKRMKEIQNVCSEATADRR